MEDVADLIRKSTRGIAELNRLSPTKKRLFSNDLTLVALAMRSGYLVDVLLPDDPVSVFTNLLQILRRESPIFKDTFHIFDPISHQSFLVNATLLRRRLACLTEIQFISLPSCDSCQLLQGVPAAVRDLHGQLAPCLDAQEVPLTISLTACDSSAGVPIAAVLIEYPLAYVPDTTLTSFLHQIPLDVYECTVRIGSHTHILLKFSCPAVLGENYPDKLSPDRIRAHLEGYFGPRFDRWEAVELQVKHHTATHDRLLL
ncbi:hypothetical protein JOM56_010681 [Amanita muscaria]